MIYYNPSPHTATGTQHENKHNEKNLSKTSSKASAMYGHPNGIRNGNSTDKFHSHFPLSDPRASQNFPPPLAIPANEYESLSAPKSEPGYSSSGCSSYSSPTSTTNYGTNNVFGSPTSFTSYEANNQNLIQRSISSQSLQKSLQKNIEGFPSMITLPSIGYTDLETTGVRKIFGTGDLQGMNLMHHAHQSDSPLLNELSIIESISKATRYSPEEKKERIQRYRSKRNQRNFNKKIKYECRKTLADGRLRIRGRFARSGEIEMTSETNCDHAGVEDDEEKENWMSILNAISANLIP